MLLQLQKTSPDNCLECNTFTNQLSITFSKTSHTYYDKTIIEYEKQEAKKHVVLLIFLYILKLMPIAQVESKCREGSELTKNIFNICKQPISTLLLQFFIMEMAFR